MVWIWLGIVIFLIFIEVITVGLTTVWFVISGFVSLILSLFIDSIEIEFSVFVLLGVLLLITTRPYLVKKLHVKESRVKDLSVRVWKCPNCTNMNNRDLNASINIMFEGVKMYMERELTELQVN